MDMKKAKQKFLISTVGVLGTLVGIAIGWGIKPSSSAPVSQQESTIVTPAQAPTPLKPSNTIPQGAEITSAYFDSAFRPISVLRFSRFDVVVATARADSQAEGDDSCGAFLESPCYFFLDPLDIYGAPQERFIGSYEEDPDKRLANKSPWGNLTLSTLTKIDESAVEFDAIEGDGGGRWHLDIATGTFSPVGVIKPISPGEGGF